MEFQAEDTSLGVGESSTNADIHRGFLQMSQDRRFVWSNLSEFYMYQPQNAISISSNSVEQ
ncbi:hypothetical protein FE257_009124 [Aspergillus nanangensis]|uniref:Uncharacterized protein n=1 Tax=Aspergillus nanangensis TaxID=2582783 RepID=A0AAD4CWS3_ASPNN|nr:hypothetical protein FE257_009124 [Aspergillus nanangensis]